MGTSTDTPIDEAFESFYRDHRARLVSTLAAAERCSADAATDAVDEAFARALARWGKVARMAAPAGWVFTVARNHLRRTRSRRSLEEGLTAGLGGPEHRTDTAPDHELWAAVAALPDRERIAVALRYLGDLTEREVAETMGVAPGTVAATLHSARRRLATALGEPDPTPARALDAKGASDA